MFFNFINLLQSQNCSDFQLENDQLFYYKQSQSLIIEQDDQNINNVEYRINYNLIERSFTLMLLSTGQVIQSKVIESLDQKQRLQKWICNLIVQSSYVITYTNVFGINDTNNEQTQNNIIEIEIDSKFPEICEEFFGYKNNQFIVFCYSINILKVYTVSIYNKTTQLLYQYNLDNLNITSCQRTYLELMNFQFIITFHKCENWNIIHLDLNKVLLNQTILQQINTDIQIKQLDDIQICVKQIKQNKLVLIENNFSSQIYIFNSYIFFDWINLQFIQHNIFERKIKKLLFSKSCLLQQIFTQTDTGQIYIWKSEIITQFNSSYQIHFINDRLFITKENEISLILTNNINYTIQLLNQTIYFVNSLNYFYQIDQELRQIQFYKYHSLQPFIKPTKKYIYIYNINLQQLSLIFVLCYKIVKMKQNEENLCKKYAQETNYCQSEIQIPLSKYIKINNIYYEIQVPKQFETQSHNQNYLDQIYQCKLSFYKLNYTLLAYSKISAVFRKNDILRYTSCNQKCPDISINIYGMQLFTKNNLLWIFKLGINEARILSFDKDDCLSIETFYIEYVPDKLTQFGIILLIQSKAQLPQIFELTPNPHSQIQQYLSENLFLNEDIIFYKKYRKQTYIQYSTILIVEQEQSVNYVRIQDIQIIDINEYGFGFQTIGVHLNQNIIIRYYFQNYEIQLSDNATFQDFTFVRPLVYLTIRSYLILLAIKSEQTYLLIIQPQDYQQIQWLTSIRCNNQNFFFQNENLVYRDENNLMRQIDIENIYLQIKNVNYTQSKLYNEYTYPIQIVSNTIGNSKECQIIINIENQCQQLLSNYYFEHKLINNNIVLPKYFYGPIFNVSITNNTNLKLLGPFLRTQQLQVCKSRYEINCILRSKVLINHIDVECYNIALNNQIHHITCQILNVNINQKNDQKLKIFQISKYQLIYFWKDQKFIYYQILFYDNIKGSFISEQIHQIDIVINNTNSLQVKKIGKLIILHNENQQKLFQFQFNQLVSISSKFELKNSISFQNNEYLFLEYQLVKNNDQLEILLTILKLEETSISILGVITLNYLRLSDLITPLIPYNQINQYFNYLKMSDFMVLKCKFEQNSIQVQIAEKLSNYLIIYDIQFNRLYQFEQGMVSKLFRNIHQLNNLIYLENSTLISENLIFDLTLEKSFYDPIHKITENDQKIHLFNTTHVIFESINNSEFYFGQFGYQLQLLNEQKEVEKFNLVAKNNVTTLQVELMLINNIQNKEIFIYFILLSIGFIIIIAFIIYQIRRQRLKIKNYIKAPQ